MKKRTAQLPEWATAAENGDIIMDAQSFYPALLQELWDDEQWPAEGAMFRGMDMSTIERGDLSRYWLEVAYQCAKLDVRLGIEHSELSPPRGGALRMIIEDGDKSLFCQKGKPAGPEHPTAKMIVDGKEVPASGEVLASRGYHARYHWKRIRGAQHLPNL